LDETTHLHHIADSLIEDLELCDKRNRTLDADNSLASETRVFVAGDGTDRNLVLCCMRAGAKEFFSAPIESQPLFSAIERVRKVIRN
jgi:FixJ family two-component response regulator